MYDRTTARSGHPGARPTHPAAPGATLPVIMASLRTAPGEDT